MTAEKGLPPLMRRAPIAINEEQHMRKIGLAALFLLASAFGALAADTGAQGAGTAPRAHKMMQHKTMHTGTARRHKAVYRHGHYRTGYYMGGRFLRLRPRASWKLCLHPWASPRVWLQVSPGPSNRDGSRASRRHYAAYRTHSVDAPPCRDRRNPQGVEGPRKEYAEQGQDFYLLVQPEASSHSICRTLASELASDKQI